MRGEAGSRENHSQQVPRLRAAPTGPSEVGSGSHGGAGHAVGLNAVTRVPARVRRRRSSLWQVQLGGLDGLPAHRLRAGTSPGGNC